VNFRSIRAAGVVTACVCFMPVSPAKEIQVPSLADVVARDFQVRTLEGSSVALADLIEPSRPLVIEFWATWCAPCRKTLPYLIRLKKDYGDELVVLGLTVEDPNTNASRVQAYVKQENVNFPIAYAPADLFQFMNNRSDIAVPKLFVFDGDGRLVTYIPRYSLSTHRKLKSAVKEALSGGK
jgi:thiol-disulfide isomerase/thioredoxin